MANSKKTRRKKCNPLGTLESAIIRLNVETTKEDIEKLNGALAALDAVGIPYELNRGSSADWI